MGWMGSYDESSQENEKKREAQHPTHNTQSAQRRIKNTKYSNQYHPSIPVESPISAIFHPVTIHPNLQSPSLIISSPNSHPPGCSQPQASASNSSFSTPALPSHAQGFRFYPLATQPSDSSLGTTSECRKPPRPTYVLHIIYPNAIWSGN